MTSTEPVAPGIAEPFRVHWYESGPVPVATAVSVTVSLGCAVWLMGTTETEGAACPVESVSDAALLCADPAGFVATNR